MTRKKRKRAGRAPERTATAAAAGRPDRDRLLCVAVLFLLPLLYFLPYLVDPGRMIFGTDWIPTGGYARVVWQRAFLLDTLTVPKWMPYLFSGFSSITAYADATFYPPNLLTVLLPVNLQRVLLFAFHAGLGGAGLFFLLRRLRCGVHAALFAGVVYEFSGVILTTTYAGHLGRMIAVAWLPVALCFLHRALVRRTAGAFLLFGGVVGLYLLGGHFQMSYLAAVSMVLGTLVYLFVGVREGWKERGRILLFGLLAVVPAAMMTAVRYLPTWSGLGAGARGAERGYAYATSWSLPIEEVFDLLVPNFSGILDDYWGLNYFKLSSEYFGAIPLLLALTTVVVCRRDLRVRLLALYAGLFLLFAWGGNTPFYHIPYAIIPLVSKLRGPAMFFFMTSFGLIALAGLGMHRLASEETGEEERRRLVRGLGVTAAAVALLALGATLLEGPVLGAIRGAVGPALEASYGTGERGRKLALLAANFPAVQARLWIAAALGLALFGGGLLRERGHLSGRWLVLGLLLLTVIDQWSVDRRFLRPAPAHEALFRADDVVKFLREDPGIFRVFPVQYRHERDGLLLLNGIETIGGYGANPPRRYQRFIGAGESVMFTPTNLVRDRRLLDLLNVKYVIVPPLPEDLSGLSPVERNAVQGFRDYLDGWPEVFRGSHAVYRNPDPLPRVYALHAAEVVADGEEALRRVLSPGFDPHRSVVLERDPGIALPAEARPAADVVVEAYGPHRVVCRVVMPAPGILVLSTNDHPDWRVTVDGEARERLHADYVAMGVAVPEGTHEVVFEYHSTPFRVGGIVTLLGFGLFAALLVGWRRGWV